MMLNIFLSREKAVEYYTALGFSFAKISTSLVISKNGKQIGWLYRRGKKVAISLKINTHQTVTDLDDFITIDNNQRFLLNNRLCIYKCDTADRKMQLNAIHLIKIPKEILELSNVKALKMSSKAYHCYGVYQRGNNKLVNVLWGAGKMKDFEHQMLIFPNLSPEYAPKLHYLKLFPYETEFDLNGKHWMVHTNLGNLCLRELDLQFKERITLRMQCKISFFM